MLLILSNTPISKHYCLCLNPCLDIPTKSKFYVKNLVTKHNKDLNSKSLIYRKIGPMSSYGHVCRQKMHKQKMKENIAERFLLLAGLLLS